MVCYFPGMFGIGGGGGARPFGIHWPALVPAVLVPQHVVILNGDRTVVGSVAPTGEVTITPVKVPIAEVPAGETMAAPLGAVVGSRSGDKTGNANLGVFARSPGAWAWLDGFLTTERLQELLPETADLTVDRYRLANIWSLNFVIRGLLGEGVAAATRQDGQAKSLGEWLRARVVDVPLELVDRQ